MRHVRSLYINFSVRYSVVDDPSTKNDNLVAFLRIWWSSGDIYVESCSEDGVLMILPPFVVDAPFFV